MRLAEAVVVVTGAGNGIGAAMSRRFAAEGATVVVNDLDADAARRVAADTGGLAVPGDASGEAGVRELVRTALDHHGRIDVFCANAGVASGGGPEVPDEVWDRAWELNVMGHVRAAREVLPHWLERGGGHFLATVSAAGLLTMLGAAPYSVTKHAALGFAEWLSVTYADRGVTVQALCPQGVRTDMLGNSGEAGERLLAADAVEPEQVADEVAAALGDDHFLILPHADVARMYARRAEDPDRWQAGMRKLQHHLDHG
ncbi:NAD(P)-dependent dehydrogenase (short-subunit alcohol dehydrogenase family) [Saccharopolyspora lacisalsi]|uniref:NAD(P)-dependent dehydrogenase (Short-subunit alcohol dehydrogenase family) n=1 Tax=Halosaccharopolyspora lacisalsi TaxID=1000566 RepID=A0A839DVG2_9PSEU|nr:SDR family oxidoreductase [Halosaccharopolyspora lacisalsi]MBA8825962.1 NAD(P)-dependent dehydrogenase (short-subunit alcohol dehydrogenase family) [Halosaccharopolyspora lacisalsi]